MEQATKKGINQDAKPKVTSPKVTATAVDDKIESLLNTAKYDIFATTYIIVTKGIEIHIALGRFLKKIAHLLEFIYIFEINMKVLVRILKFFRNKIQIIPSRVRK